jgi:UDP-N-acetylglucosamine--N-acetylmuramyl-(pentapeptide) pyrophosphoryl-undecaprenol N-acetylglucosamine transferase
MSKKIMLVAGGTGGHVFPALALSDALSAKGAACVFVGDKRTADLYTRNNRKVYLITVATFGAGIYKKLRGLFLIIAGLIESLDILREEKPNLVIGFGGYPSFPTVFAAQILGIPTFLHEQNAILGRANRVLLRLAKVLAISFTSIKSVPVKWNSKMVYTGNPIRAVFTENVIEYPDWGGKIRLAITGGSQGSKIFTKLVPQAIEMMHPDLRARLSVMQQVRAEDMEEVTAAYARMGVRAELAPFFDDMKSFFGRAHLVICRAGASTVAEITAMGRPALFIPLAISLDGDQAQNAAQLVTGGAAWVLTEKDANPATLSGLLEGLLSNPATLEGAAKAATKIGRPQAADDLADLILRYRK